MTTSTNLTFQMPGTTTPHRVAPGISYLYKLFVHPSVRFWNRVLQEFVKLKAIISTSTVFIDPPKDTVPTFGKSIDSPGIAPSKTA